MKLYFAPMEGVTGYIFRNVYNDFFGRGIIDKYFTPFISPNKSKGFQQKEINDLLPEHNFGMKVIPQILANEGNAFLRAADMICNYGYDEVNLNIGCPSGTVVSKKKGAGLLSDMDMLNNYLEEVFDKKPDNLKVSIKTRIGMDSPEEFDSILLIYNDFPLEELIIHPRVQKDYYNNFPNMECYKFAATNSVNPICFNGNIFSINNYNCFMQEDSAAVTAAVMLGRGLIGNPELALQINGKARDSHNVYNKEKLKKFHDTLFYNYRQIMPGDINAVYKMKEIWFYMKYSFNDSHKYSKRIKKANRVEDYIAAVNDIFENCDISDIKVVNFR